MSETKKQFVFASLAVSLFIIGVAIVSPVSWSGVSGVVFAREEDDGKNDDSFEDEKENEDEDEKESEDEDKDDDKYESEYKKKDGSQMAQEETISAPIVTESQPVKNAVTETTTMTVRQSAAKPEVSNAGDDIFGNNVASETAKIPNNFSGMSEDIIKQVNSLISDQNVFVGDMAQLTHKIRGRGVMTSFFIGSDSISINAAKQELAASQERVQSLVDIADYTMDENARALLREKIDTMQMQNKDLQKFIASHENIPSLFGWLARLFA